MGIKLTQQHCRGDAVGRRGAIPQEIEERIDKAAGHARAAERWLWQRTELGFWSGGQAKARLAEIWLSLQGRMTLPPADRYLPNGETGTLVGMMRRLLPPDDPIAAAWDEIDWARAAIHAAPVEGDPYGDRASLTGRIERGRRYLDALTRAGAAIEDAVATCHPAWRAISHAELRDPCDDALLADDVFFDLHEGGRYPDPDAVRLRIGNELQKALLRQKRQAGLDIGIGRDVAYADIWQQSEGTGPVPAFATDRRADVVVTDVEGVVRHVFEIWSRWDDAGGMEALRRLDRFLDLCREDRGDAGKLRSAALLLYHNQGGSPGEPPALSFDETCSLDDLILRQLKAKFGHPEGRRPAVALNSFDRITADHGKVFDAAVTCLWVQFHAYAGAFPPIPDEDLLTP